MTAKSAKEIAEDAKKDCESRLSRLPFSEEIQEDPMCPACIANAALVAGSLISTGGIGALVAKVVWSKKSEPNDNPKANSEKEK